MSDTATVNFQRITGTEVGPGVWHPGWIPDTGTFPELIEAHDEIIRLRAAWQAAGQRTREIEGRIEADKAQRATGLRDAYLRGDESPQAAQADEALSAELADAKEHSRAAIDALLAHINNSIALVIERGPEWLSAIAEMDRSVVDEIVETEAKVRELRAKTGTNSRLEHWIARTADAAQMPVQHFPYAEIAAPPTGNEHDDAAQLHASALKSYGGGLPGSTLVSDKQIADARARSDRRQEGEPTEDTVELSTLDDDDLVDWLMGTGMFDGDPRPPAALVLSVAEGDPAMAARLLKAEARANPEGERGDLTGALTKITKGKAGA